ncbi:hypothetical protein ACHAXT_004627 [Thalassiosira profunda]
MGASGKYVGLPGTGPALEAEGSVPIVPVATAVDPSAFEDASSLPTASMVDAKNKQDNVEEREDGITITWEKGEYQPPAFRDIWFAIAFIVHLVGVIGAAVALGPAAWDKIAASSDAESEQNESAYGEEGGEGGSNEDEVPPKEFWAVVVAISCVVAPALSFLALTVMNRNATGLIKASLWFSVVLCGLAAVLLMATAPPAGIFYAVITVCLVWYMRTVQSRIPYAASNLKAGITVLKANLGLGLVALGSMAGLLLYCFGWTWAFVGTMQLDVMWDAQATGQYNNNQSNSQGESDLSALGGFAGFVFILCFYWSHQVVKNIVRVTVSGVVGSWWFNPLEAGSFCSTAVTGSFVRSTTYSLGSNSAPILFSSASLTSPSSIFCLSCISFSSTFAAFLNLALSSTTLMLLSFFMKFICMRASARKSFWFAICNRSTMAADTHASRAA